MEQHDFYWQKDGNGHLIGETSARHKKKLKCTHRIVRELIVQASLSRFFLSFLSIKNGHLGQLEMLMVTAHFAIKKQPQTVVNELFNATN